MDPASIRFDMLFDADEYYRSGICPWTFFAYPTSLSVDRGLPPDNEACELLGHLQKRGIDVAIWVSGITEDTTYFACRKEDIQRLHDTLQDLEGTGIIEKNFCGRRSELLFSQLAKGSADVHQPEGDGPLDDTANFLFEVSARACAAVPALLCVGALALVTGLTLAVPMFQERWWVSTLAVIGPIVFLLVVAWFGPVVIRGGLYRATISGGRVQVDSPSPRVFGPSFEVDLGAIERLTVRRIYEDWSDEYEVHTPDGIFQVDSICGKGLFDAVRRARPEVPYEFTR